MSTAGSRLAGVTFTDPQHEPGWRHVPVPAGNGRALPSEARDLAVEVVGAGRSRGLAEWVEETSTTSLLVLDGGTIVHEWYAEGLGPETLFLGASMTKSVLAHLVGRAVREGALALTDEVINLVPELSGTGYDGTCVLDVLTMTTGVEWVEDHRDPDSLASRLLGCFATSGDSRALLREVGAGVAPGIRFSYCTADSQVLDWVRERATGRAYPEDVARLWQDLGCGRDAAVAVDGTGVAMAGGGLAATARDWARVALLAVDGGGLLDPDVGRGSRASGVPLPGARTVAQQHHHARRLRLPLVADGRRRSAADRRREPRPVRVRRPAHRRRRGQDLAVALRRLPRGPTGPRPQLSRTARPARRTATEGDLPVNRNVMITCALTGAGDTVGRSEHVPVTPEQIAESGIAAARAGATIVHVHVRDPETGKGSREVGLYREVVERIRASEVDVIINTTAGMGGDLVLDPQDPTRFVEGTDLVSGVDRLRACGGAAAGYLHAGLWEPELRGGQPGLCEYPGHAPGGREADPGARGAV